jgi:hypothetical protein
MLSDKNARKTPYKRIWRVALSLAAVSAIGCGYTLLDEGTRAELTSPHLVVPELAKDSPVKRLAAGTADRLRQVFRYSVVSGGLESPREARKAADLDPVVRDHYRGIELSKVKAEILSKDTLAYVSYRINDQVYWTRNKVELHQGELLLTDGKNAIRARCGNRISAAPVPTYAASEPKPAEFEIAQMAVPPMPLDQGTVDTPANPAVSDAAMASTARHIPAAPMSTGFIPSSMGKWKYVAPLAAGAGTAAWATSRGGSKSTSSLVAGHSSEPTVNGGVPTKSSASGNPPSFSENPPNQPGNPPSFAGNPPNQPGNPPSFPGNSPNRPGGPPVFSGNPPPPPFSGNPPNHSGNPPDGPPVHTPPPMGPPVTVTPEPATFTGLLGIGLGWLFLRSRKKTRS